MRTSCHCTVRIRIRGLRTLVTSMSPHMCVCARPLSDGQVANSGYLESVKALRETLLVQEWGMQAKTWARRRCACVCVCVRVCVRARARTMGRLG